VTTYEEWRVTGTLADAPYKFTWTPPHGRGYDPEGDARRFADKLSALAWTDGPHLHKRTVTVTDWEDADRSAPKSRTGIVWICTRCNRELAGNPRLCPHCGYTVYRPKEQP